MQLSLNAPARAQASNRQSGGRSVVKHTFVPAVKIQSSRIQLRDVALQVQKTSLGSLVGEKVPNFELIDVVSNSPIDLYEYTKGAPATLLMFVSCHCPFVKMLKVRFIVTCFCFVCFRIFLSTISCFPPPHWLQLSEIVRCLTYYRKIIQHWPRNTKPVESRLSPSTPTVLKHILKMAPTVSELKQRNLATHSHACTTRTKTWPRRIRLLAHPNSWSLIPAWYSSIMDSMMPVDQVNMVSHRQQLA